MAYVVAATFAVTSLVGWIGYLLFLRFLVKHTNDPASLRDAAVAAKAFRTAGVSLLAAALMRRIPFEGPLPRHTSRSPHRGTSVPEGLKRQPDDGHRKPG